MPSRKSTRNPRRYRRRRNCIFNSRRRQRQQQQRQQQQQQQLQRGGADATSLSSILPANSFYPYNANTLPNPADVRAQPMQQQQQQQQPPVYTQMHAHMQGGRRRSYAGKQVGCRTLRRSRSKSRSRSSSKSRTRHGYRSRSQSGGDSISYLPSDANMLLRSATTFAGNLVSGLKGEPGSPSPLPFEDQSIQNPRSL